MTGKDGCLMPRRIGIFPSSGAGVPGAQDPAAPAENFAPHRGEFALACKKSSGRISGVKTPPTAQPQTAAAWLEKISPLRPALALVLGSGFHPALAELRVEKKIAYARIPGFPRPTVRGHAGELYFGHFGKTPVLVLDGRAHFYEGHPMARVTFAVRALAAFGIRDLLLTNAAGGINRKFQAGDFMVLTDHINLMGTNPLRPAGGEAWLPLPSFVDLTETYDARLRALLFRAGKKARLKLQRGVYLAVSGPSYETPAEIRAFARLGADAVGMSTVPEAVAARQCGLNVAAVSCITNLAAATGREKLSHAAVLATAARVGKSGARLIRHFAELYGEM